MGREGKKEKGGKDILLLVLHRSLSSIHLPVSHRLASLTQRDIDRENLRFHPLMLLLSKFLIDSDWMVERGSIGLYGVLDLYFSSN